MFGSSKVSLPRRAVIAWIELLALAVLSVLVATQVFRGPGGTAGAPVIVVVDGWARATPPGAATGAAYVRIVNNGGRADTLVAVDTPAAGEVSIHRTTVENDRAAMVALDGGLEVAAGATVILAPGDTHMMLENLVAPLREGDTIAIGLVFAETGRVEINLTVLGVGANGRGAP